MKLKMCIIGLSLALFSSCAVGDDAATVYFIPFQVETYIPVTEETIVSQAWEKWTTSSKSEISRLTTLLEHGSESKFDGNRVRAMVLLDGQRYLIDSNGVVKTKGRASIRIDKGKFIEFLTSLRASQREELNPLKAHR